MTRLHCASHGPSAALNQAAAQICSQSQQKAKSQAQAGSPPHNEVLARSAICCDLPSAKCGGDPISAPRTRLCYKEIGTPEVLARSLSAPSRRHYTPPPHKKKRLVREKQWLPGHLIGHECQPRPPDHTAYRHWHGMAAPPRHRVPCPLHDPDAPSTSSMIALPRHRVPCPLYGTGATPTPAQTPTIHRMTWLHLSTTRHRRHSDPGI